MCERCADLDYRVADIWRPCWKPPTKPVTVLIDDGRILAKELKDAHHIIDQQAEAIRHLEATQRWPHLLATNETIPPKLID